jgi:apolipoprotein N-acyltransferase
LLAAWQPVIPTREKFSEERQRQLPVALKEALEHASRQGAEALVAPEGTLFSGGIAAVDGQPLPLLSGGFRWVRGSQRSSLLLIKPGDLKGRALLDKHRLVPLGEALPPLPAGLTAGLSAVGGLQPGSPQRLFTGFQAPGAAAICYEISDGNALAAATAIGGEWLLTIANLDPYPGLLQRQFLALARMRAIETDRDLLSVANTGPTALVRADGSVQSLLPSGEPGVATGSLSLRSAPSPYAVLREWPLVVTLTLATVMCLKLRKADMAVRESTSAHEACDRLG